MTDRIYVPSLPLHEVVVVQLYWPPVIVLILRLRLLWVCRCGYGFESGCMGVMVGVRQGGCWEMWVRGRGCVAGPSTLGVDSVLWVLVDVAVALIKDVAVVVVVGVSSALAWSVLLQFPHLDCSGTERRQCACHDDIAMQSPRLALQGPLLQYSQQVRCHMLRRPLSLSMSCNQWDTSR